MAEIAKATTGVVSRNVKQCIDVFEMLRGSFNIKPETKQKAIEYEKELSHLEFKKFNESIFCRDLKGVPVDKFEEFLGRLQKRFEFPDEAKESLLDGLDADENEEAVTDLRFKDGKGTVHQARFVMLKAEEKMDIAYVVYSLDFELSEKQIMTTKQDYWFGWIPVGCEEVTITKESQNLKDGEMDKFSQLCLVKLYNKVQDEI